MLTTSWRVNPFISGPIGGGFMSSFFLQGWRHSPCSKEYRFTCFRHIHWTQSPWKFRRLCTSRDPDRGHTQWAWFCQLRCRFCTSSCGNHAECSYLVGHNLHNFHYKRRKQSANLSHKSLMFQSRVTAATGRDPVRKNQFHADLYLLCPRYHRWSKTLLSHRLDNSCDSSRAHRFQCELGSNQQKSNPRN